MNSIIFPFKQQLVIGLIYCLIHSIVIIQTQGQALSENFDVTSFKPDDGLAGDKVCSIEAMNDSVWFACWGRGISCYDGYRWINYNDSHGLPTKDVKYIFSDRENRIWAGTTRGIAIKEANEWKTIETPISGLARPLVNHISQITDGAIWFRIIDGQILQFIPNANGKNSKEKQLGLDGLEGQWSVILNSNQTQTNKIHTILPLKNGETWVSIANLGILSYQNGEWKNKWESSDKRLIPSSLVQMDDESVWGTAENILIHYTQENRQIIPLGEMSPTCLGRSQQDVLLLGTWKGLFQYAGGLWHKIYLDENANDMPIITINEGKNNDVWVGGEAGTYRLTEKAWIKSNLHQDNHTLPAIFFHTDRKQKPIAADTSGLLYEWKGDRWELLANLNPRKSIIWDISYSGEGKLWVCFSERLVEFDLARKAELRSLNIPVSNAQLKVYYSPAHRLFLYGGNKIYEYQSTLWQLERVHDDENVTALFEDPIGALWAQWSDKTERQTNKIWKSSTELNKTLANHALESIAKSNDELPLLGLADAGIFVLKDGQLHALASFEGRNNKQSITLFHSSDGAIWSGHRQYGISSYRNGLWITYDQTQGVPAGRAEFIGEDPNGELWAAIGSTEIIRYRPSMESPVVELVAPSVSIYNGDSGVFNFVGKDKWKRTPTEKISYSWRIIPANDGNKALNWSAFQLTQYAIIPQLKPGSYYFEVRAMDAERNVSLQPIRHAFEIMPKIWQRPAFYVPLTGLSLCALFLMFLWLRKHELLKATLMNLENMVKERTAEISRVNQSLSTEVEERKRAASTLQRQMDFNSLITDFLTRFASGSGMEIDDMIQACLKQIGVYFNAEAVLVIQLSISKTEWSITHEWNAPGVSRLRENYQDIPLGTHHWIEQKIIAGQVVQINSLKDFPPEAAFIRQQYEQEGIKCLLQVPIQGQGGAIKGGLGLVCMSREIKWTDEDALQLRMAGDTIANVLERQRTEQEVQKQAALLDIAQDGIAVMDIDGKVRYWNRGAERMMGWTAKELIGNTLNPDTYNACHETLAIAEEFLQKAGFWKGELVLYTKDNRKLLVQSSRTLVRDKNGKPQSIFVVNSDITEQKQIESQLMRMQRVESVGRLANGIAHDLNNILTPILMGTELLSEGKNNEAEPEFVELIRTSAQRGTDLVKQLLLFSRGSDGHIIELDLKKLAGEIARIIQETFPKSIQYHIDIPPDLGKIEGDATQIHQVLLNLCVNARDAMPNGGILRLGIENAILDENAMRINPEAKAGSFVVIKVADTGTGIAPEILDKIFDPFFTTKEMGKGTGLGLSTVMGIVKKHNGFIDIKSQLGRGSEFRIFLPALSTSQAQVLSSKSESKLQGNGELILIADDEASIRHLASKSLLSNGYQVLLAQDGREAVSLYLQHQQEIRAVVMDLEMPIMNGITAIQELKKINLSIPIIATTGYGHLPDQLKTAGLTVKVFLPKPWNASQLLKLITEIIQTSGTK